MNTSISEVFKIVCSLRAAGEIRCHLYKAPRTNVFLGIESHIYHILVKFVTSERLLPTNYLLNNWS